MQVKSIIHLRPPESDQVTVNSHQNSSNSGQEGEPTGKETAWEPEVILDESQFSPDEVSIIRNMLREESQAFSKDPDDVGCAEEPQLNIEQTNPTPVQKNYNSVPPALHREVKDYIIDLVNKGWIRKT